MAVSRKTLNNSTYIINDDYWFTDNFTRDRYFIDNPYNLLAGIYCATGGNPDSVDYDIPEWTLQQYNGNSWLNVTANSNYTLTITNEGLRALSNIRNGNYVVAPSRIKMISDIIKNSTIPLQNWTDEIFCGPNSGNTLVINWNNNNTGSTNEFANHVTYNFNLANGGIQYNISLKSTDHDVNGNANFYVGAIGLYIKSQYDETSDILFGIACLPERIYKVGTTVDSGIGNTLKFYLNTVINNLGYVSDLKNIEQSYTSIPEVFTDADLRLINGGVDDNHNIYLVDNLNDTGVPALAVRQGNINEDTLTWTYFTPSDNVLTLEKREFADNVSNYMAVYYDDTLKKYVPADGNSLTSNNKAIRVGNNLVFNGSVRNLGGSSNFYEYDITLDSQNIGTGYKVGEILSLASSISKYIEIKVEEVNNRGSITSISFTPQSGTTFIESGSYSLYYKTGSSGEGTGAKVDIICSAIPSYNWSFNEEDVNKPVYVSKVNPGYLSTEYSNIFIGWITSTNSIKLGLDLSGEANYEIYGTTRYATDNEVKHGSTNQNKEITSVNPANLQTNYLQKTLVSGEPGSTRSNQIVVDTYTSFTKTIVGTGTDVDGVAFKGTAYRALWADLAEYYTADKVYPAGTLITIGSGIAEITEATTECNGIVSDKPGYELGDKKSDHDLPIALVGKVPVLFDGECDIHFGDKIYLSKLVPGRASTIENGNCLGKVIEKDFGTKLKIMCSVRINF